MSPEEYLNRALASLSERDLPAVYAQLKGFWASTTPSQGYEVLAKACLDAGRLELVEAHAQAFLAADPPVEALSGLAGHCVEHGVLDVAEQLLGAVVARCPEDSEAWNDLGVVQWSLRRRDAALSSLERAVALDPAHAEAGENLATVQAAPVARRLRVLALSDARSPHTQRFVRHLAGLGYEVHLLCDVWVDIPGVMVHAPESPVPVLNFQAWTSMAQQLIRELKPDLLHGHYASIYGLWGALTGFHPFALTLWGSDINVDPHLSPQYGKLVRFALDQADLIIGQSQDLNAAAERLAATAIVRPHQLTFGIDTQRFLPDLDTSALRERLGLGAGPVLLSPRQFKSAANIHRILEAAPEVLSRYPSARFVLNTVITPHDEYYLKLLGMIEDLGIASSVHILADVPYDEMPAMYNLASLTLSVRDADGASNTVMESLSCQTPVIASDIASNRELMGPASGLLVNPHQPGALAQAMLAILDDPARAAEMGRQGRERILDLHDHQRNMTRMVKLYDPLLEGHGQGRPLITQWQGRAIALTQAGLHEPAQKALEHAAGLARTPWEKAQVILTAELVGEAPGPSRVSDAFAAILASP